MPPPPSSETPAGRSQEWLCESTSWMTVSARTASISACRSKPRAGAGPQCSPDTCGTPWATASRCYSSTCPTRRPRASAGISSASRRRVRVCRRVRFFDVGHIDWMSGLADFCTQGERRGMPWGLAPVRRPRSLVRLRLTNGLFGGGIHWGAPKARRMSGGSVVNPLPVRQVRWLLCNEAHAYHGDLGAPVSLGSR